MAEINGISIPFIPLGGAESLSRTPRIIDKEVSSTKFGDVLNEELVKFSGHAQNRMVSRDITLDKVDMLRLDEAVEKARDKGAKESLIMLDDKMFIVAVDNKTVVTMFDKSNMDSDVITNIDSAVFA
ncbi:MAG: flagellar protein [Ignavibacteria bacterium]|jgi:flagellar operon protein|nr:flagellar protein [Ignavibacteria bacterium]